MGKTILSPEAYQFLLFVILGFTLYLVVDIWRYRRKAYELTPGQVRRRLGAAILLEIDLVVWLSIDAVVMNQPPQIKLSYMFAATALLMVPLYLAMREALFLMRQSLEMKRDHVRKVTDEMRASEEQRRRE